MFIKLDVLLKVNEFCFGRNRWNVEVWKLWLRNNFTVEKPVTDTEQYGLQYIRFESLPRGEGGFKNFWIQDNPKINNFFDTICVQKLQWKLLELMNHTNGYIV